MKRGWQRAASLRRSWEFLTGTPLSLRRKRCGSDRWRYFEVRVFYGRKQVKLRIAPDRYVESADSRRHCRSGAPLASGHARWHTGLSNAISTHKRNRRSRASRARSLVSPQNEPASSETLATGRKLMPIAKLRQAPALRAKRQIQRHTTRPYPLENRGRYQPARRCIAHL